MAEKPKRQTGKKHADERDVDAIQSLIDNLILEVTRDPVLRANFIADPRKVLESVGVTLPEDTTPQILESRGKNLCIVLPAIEEELAQGLSDDVLNFYIFGCYKGTYTARCTTNSTGTFDCTHT